MEDSKQALMQYPIQLRFVGVKELSITGNKPPTDDEEIATSDDLTIDIGGSDYDDIQKQFQATLTLKAGHKEETKLPYNLLISIIGFFEVGEGFNPAHIEHWIRNNSPFIMLPFMRSHAHMLTTQAGYKPLIVPMAVVPMSTLKVEDENQQESPE